MSKEYSMETPKLTPNFTIFVSANCRLAHNNFTFLQVPVVIPYVIDIIHHKLTHYYGMELGVDTWTKQSIQSDYYTLNQCKSRTFPWPPLPLQPLVTDSDLN